MGTNRFGVIKRTPGVWFPKPIPQQMHEYDALFFAAYIVAAVDKNGEDFAQVLRQVRAETKTA